MDASKNSYTLVKVCFVKSLTKASLSLYYQTAKIHENISADAIFCRRQSLILETLRYPEIGVRVTGSAMFFSFCGDVIDLTR